MTSYIVYVCFVYSDQCVHAHAPKGLTYAHTSPTEARRHETRRDEMRRDETRRDVTLSGVTLREVTWRDKMRRGVT